MDQNQSIQHEDNTSSVLHGPAKISDDFANKPEAKAAAADMSTSQLLQNPRSTTLLQLFQSQALKTPDKLAILENYEAKQISYRQLSLAAQNLSNLIKQQLLMTASSNEFIAILLPQGIQYIKSLLAIWMVGKIPVPVSIDCPIAQLRFILREDLGNPLIITTPELIEMIGKDDMSRTIDLSTQVVNPDQVMPEDQEDVPISESDPDTHETAYCFFTSGSTGRPKGVLVNHSSYMNAVNWEIKQFEIRPTDRSLVFGSPVFDISVLEIWPFLATGGSLFIPPSHYRYDVNSLLNWMHHNHITVTIFPTAVGSRVLGNVEGCLSKLSSLRWLVVGGEALTFYPPPSLPFAILNLYGPTEAAVLSTFIVLDKHDRDQIPPIGKPINNARIHLLSQIDNDLITEAGKIGEICISGVGVAKGYLNRPELTEEKFISNSNPFDDDPAYSRMYRSGDLGYWNDDENLCYVGRIDNQIKFNGFRIELGNIEKTLGNVDGIEQAIVALEDENDLKYLAAYCTLKSGTNESQTEIIEGLGKNLYSFLKIHLAHYEIPSRIYILPRPTNFPLTIVGKIDRKQVPSLKSNAILITSSHEALESDIENMIGQIWSGLLNLPFDSIGKHDNFFGLGGNSILAIQMLHMLQHMLQDQGKRLAGFHLHHVFRLQTIYELAKLVDASISSSASSQEITEYSGNSGSNRMELSYPQQLIWAQMVKTNEIDWYQFNQAISLKFHKIPDKRILKNAIHRLFERHNLLKSTFQHDRDGHGALIMPTADYQLDAQIIDLTNRTYTWPEGKSILMNNADVALVNVHDGNNGPLIKFYILQLAPNDFNIHIIGHQLLLDVTSFNIIIWELQQSVQLQLKSTGFVIEATTPKKPGSQYKDFIAWQKYYETTVQYGVSLEFWKSYLENWTPIQFTTEEDSNTNLDFYAGLVLPFQLDHAQTKMLKIFAKEKRTTVFNVLMTTYKILLYSYMNRKSCDICLLSIVLGRDEIEFGETVGHFTNPIIVRTRNIHGSIQFGTFLQEIHENTTTVYEHGEIPFQKIMHALNQNAPDLSSKQLFNACIQMTPRSPIHLKTVRNIFQTYESDFTSQQIMLTVEEVNADDRHIDGFLEANSNIFSSNQLVQFVSNFKTVLQIGINFPTKTIDELIQKLTM